MKRFLLLGLLALCLLGCGGCNASVMERQTFVLCVTFDIDKEDKLTIGVLTPKNGGGDEAGSVPEYTMFSASGDTVQQTFALLSDSSPSPINFSQLKLCVISYELAAKQELLPMLEWLNQIPDMRPTAVVTVALGNAKEIIQAQKPDFGMRMSIFLNIYLQQMRSDQTSPCTTLVDCIRDLDSRRIDPILGICAINPAIQAEQQQKQSGEGGKEGGGGAQGGESKEVFSDSFSWGNDMLKEGDIAGMLPRSGDNPVEYLGAATIGNGRVSGLLSVEETQIVMRVRQYARLKLALDGDKTQLQIWLRPAHEEKQKLTAEKVKKTVEKLQLLHCDALGFGNLAAATVYTDVEWERLKMEQRYPLAEVYVGLE